MNKREIGGIIYFIMMLILLFNAITIAYIKKNWIALGTGFLFGLVAYIGPKVWEYYSLESRLERSMKHKIKHKDNNL